MGYKPVSWSQGEPFNHAKLLQMVENDEAIHNLYLKTPLGTIAEDVYLDVIGGASITAAPGAWTDVIVLNDVFLYPSRWIKITAIVHGAGAVDRGTYIPFRVTMGGTEVLWMRTPDAALAGTQHYSSISGSRVMQSQPGTYQFKLQIGNDYVSATHNTSITPVGPKNPTMLTIDDIGGTDV